MKKVFKVLFIMIFVVFISACSDKKFYDTSINVDFYTGTNGTIVPKQENLEANSKLVEPVEPTRPGYDFDGWYKEVTYKNEWNFAVDLMGTHSITLFAKWIAVDYTITYVLNGGEPLTGSYPTTYNLNNARLTVFPTTVRQTGYAFVGWYLYDWKNAEGKIMTKPGDFGYNSVPTGKTENLTLYAHWKAIESVISFNINFPEPTGAPAAPKSFTISYGSIIAFTIPTAEGYTFKGWNSKANGSGDYYINGELYTRTQNLTVYAIWEKNN